MENNSLMNKEDSEWIAKNMLMNYCILDDNIILKESFIKNIQLPFNFDVDCFHFCVTGLDKKYIDYKTAEELNEGVLKNEILYNKINDLLYDNGYLGTTFFIKVDNSKKMAVIFSPIKNSSVSAPENIATQLSLILNEHYCNKCSRYLVTSLVENYHGYENLHRAYKEANRLNNLYFFNEFHDVITNELIMELSMDCGLSAIDENARKLKNLLCTSSFQEISAQVDFLFLDLIANSYNFNYFRIAFVLCELMINLFIKVYDMNFTFDICKSADDYDTLNDYVNDLKKIIFEINENLRGKTLYNARILTTIGFIKENFHKDISLKGIADYLNISVPTLSSDFNKEVGCSISDYINQCRVNSAKKLLIQSDYTIAQISQKVGFTNPKYFSQIFKDIMEVGPLQYRKLNEKNEIIKR